jgi:hypothetical protein
MRAYEILMGFLATGLLVSTASAQLIVNPIGKPANDKIEAGLSLAYSSMDYVLPETDDSVGIKRMVMGVSLATAVDETTDICGSIAWLAKSDPDADGWNSSGGYLLSFGARMRVFERGLGTVALYGLGHYMAETYDIHDSSYKMFLFEATGGAVAAYAFNTMFTGYAGAELVAYSDGELRGNTRPDFDRDGRVTIRAGAVFDMTTYLIRTELALGSETTLMVGVSQLF